MAHIGKISRPGEGECGSLNCPEPKAPGRLLCEQHSADMDRIRQELHDDPNKLYNRRSDNPNRIYADGKKTKTKKTPTCCVIGCFNERVPPSPYCFAHEEEGYE